MGCSSSSGGPIADYKSYGELMSALQQCGVLEDLEIIVGIDATKSNEMSGAQSFGGRCLHDLNFSRDNPYMACVKTAIKFFQRDLDSNIPLCYFGSDEANRQGGVQVVKTCRGRDDLVATYRESIPYQTLSGPTTFIPLVNHAVERCKAAKKYHILLIITDGAVQDEEKHYECLTNASHYPLSIVCVGVGDGPWDIMNRFDDKMPPGKVFDNFQFVSFPEISKKEATQAMQEEFFFQAFMEVPIQYEQIKKKLAYKPPSMPVAMPPSAAAPSSVPSPPAGSGYGGGPPTPGYSSGPATIGGYPSGMGMGMGMASAPVHVAAPQDIHIELGPAAPPSYEDPHKHM